VTSPARLPRIPTGARVVAVLRLLALQGAWSYDRMQGIGFGWAAAPLLAPLDSEEARARSTEFFNAHPNLAGLAVGAQVRAEFDGVPGAQIRRLREALCGPLGALGDQVFWAGVVPGLVAAAVAAVALGGGLAAALALPAAYAAVRLGVSAWSLRTGLRAGLGVGRAMHDSWLARRGRWAGPAAAFAVGTATALAGARLLGDASASRAGLALAVAAGTLLAGRLWKSRATPPRIALLAAGVTLLLRWATA
jgi:PTS system mannose-specific IID component